MQVSLSDNPFLDRPGLSAANLLSGDFSGAGRAIWDPDSLSPTERRSLAQRVGLDGTPLETLTNVIANPIVLAGIAMSFRWPIPTAEKLVSFSSSLNTLQKKFPWTKWFSPVSENFRGTKIPDLLEGVVRVANTQRNKYHTMWGEALSRFEKTAGRAFSKDDELVVAAAMDASELFDPKSQMWTVARKRLVTTPGLAASLESLPQAPKLSPAQAQLVADTHRLMDQVWNDHLADPHNQEILRDILGKKQGFKDSLHAKELRRVFGFFPHMRLLSPEQRWESSVEFLKDHFGSDLRTKLGRNREVSISSISAADRLGSMLPDPEALKKLGFNGDQIKAVQAATAGAERNSPIHYNLKYGDAIDHYLDNITKAVAWSIPEVPVVGGKRLQGYGVRLREEMARLVESKDPYAIDAVRTVHDVIAPQVMGGMSVNQSNQALKFAAAKSTAIDFVNKPFMKKALGSLHPKLTSWLQNDPNATWPGIGHTISKTIYLSTLGAPNFVPPALNLLQPITNMLGLGYGYLGAAYKETGQQLLKYAQYRLPESLGGAGLSMEAAIQKAMPAFAAAHLELDPTAREAIGSALDAATNSVFKTRFKTFSGKAEAALLGAFSHSELSNRLVAFNAAYTKGLHELPGKEWYFAAEDVLESLPKDQKHPAVQRAASEFAAKLTRTTQFGSGPLEKPQGTLEWWQPLSQFTTFPARQASLVLGPMLRNPGYLGRSLAAAGTAYEVGKTLLGTDVSRGLIFGGLPQVTSGLPFSPLPVPPFLQAVGAAGLSIAEGDTTQVRRALPLAIPGGVGLARLAGSLPGGGPVARTVGKPYADYSKRTPDGRVPVFNAKGVLTGYYSETQLLAKAIGLGDVQGAQEQELTKYFLAQRDAVREMKAQYLQALSEGDPDDALKIQQDYERRYPGQGGIPVKKSDIDALHMRQDVTRLERVLQTLPPELRPQFQATISTALGANADAFLGLQTGGLQSGRTAVMRDPYRHRQRGDTAQAVSQGLHGVKLRDKLRREGANPNTNALPSYTGTGLYYQGRNNAANQPF